MAHFPSIGQKVTSLITEVYRLTEPLNDEGDAGFRFKTRKSVSAIGALLFEGIAFEGRYERKWRLFYHDAWMEIQTTQFWLEYMYDIHCISEQELQHCQEELTDLKAWIEWELSNLA